MEGKIFCYRLKKKDTAGKIVQLTKDSVGNRFSMKMVENVAKIWVLFVPT